MEELGVPQIRIIVVISQEQAAVIAAVIFNLSKVRPK